MSINSSGRYRVSINTPKRTEIRTVGIAPTVGQSGVNRLSQLIDVNASDPDNNETLVYDAASGKYVIKELPVVNGGNF